MNNFFTLRRRKFWKRLLFLVNAFILFGNLIKATFLSFFKDGRPFYLEESFPWTTEYAKSRNYTSELLHLCNQVQVVRWRKVKKAL